MFERGALAAMGTRFEIVAAGAPASQLRASIEEALEEISLCHQRWSPFSPSSMLSQINRSQGEGVAVDGLTMELLSQCQRWHGDTAGAFDPCVGHLLSERDPRRSGHEDSGILKNASRDSTFIGLANVEINVAKNSIRLLQPDLQLDLGAVAKGFAIDLATDVLRDAGIPSAFLHGGNSSISTIGQPPGASAWKVQLPQSSEVLELRDQSLAVSASKGQYAGEHLLNPLTGEWIDAESGGYWVRSKSAAEADVWSTALTVNSGSSESIKFSMPDDMDWGPLRMATSSNTNEKTSKVSVVKSDHWSFLPTESEDKI
ncbi:MAG: hypothetical protein GWP35_02215 [Proteobacteria bacterium]|nr:hypothetical protein [Pseudomonadota bacterium]